MRVTIATRGWDQSKAAVAVGVDADGVAKACLGIAWIEIDGRRYHNVISAKIGMDKGVQTLDLSLVAATDVVIVDGDGEILEP